MTDDRRAAILRAVVEHYVRTSQPVSSSTVVNSGGVQASPATIRSEMAALEREGFLTQPHTSAGRIPTDRGYRFFVDDLNGAAPLVPSQAPTVKQFFDEAQGELEQMLHSTGRLLTDMTGAASVVTAEGQRATVRSLQIVTLAPGTALVVVVYSDGAVEKRTIDIDLDTEDHIAVHASRFLTAAADGTVLEAMILGRSGDDAVDRLAQRALTALRAPGSGLMGDKVFVGGASHLASSFEAVEVVRNVLTILEQQYVVVTLIRSLLDRGMTVSIGAEHNVVPLAQCSLIMAPTFVNGERRGAVAVLGPTRMDYARAMAAVTLVSEGLGDRLSDPDR